MGRIVVRASVDAPRETVFDRLADVERVPEYSTLTRAVTYVSPGPVGRGTRWRENSPLGPVPTTCEWTIEDYDRPDRLVLGGTSTFVDARVVIDLDDTDGTTRIRQVTDHRFLPALGPVGRFLDDLAFEWMLARAQCENMRSFRRMVEAEAG